MAGMSNPVIKDGLYRGTIAYDEPLRTEGLPWSKVLGGRQGKRNDPEYNRLRHLAWRNKNREHWREYMREYKKKWRAKKRSEAIAS